VQPTTRRGCADAMIFCVAVQFLGEMRRKMALCCWRKMAKNGAFQKKFERKKLAKNGEKWRFLKEI
jgi:hypothetical protein